MIRRFHEAKVKGLPSVTVWGSGHPTRDFLHVDDLAEACLFIMNRKEQKEMLNIGSGVDVSIRELAGIVAKVVKYEGDIIWDVSKPDGTPKKALDSSKLQSLGWSPKIPLTEGLPVHMSGLLPIILLLLSSCWFNLGIKIS